MLLEIETSTVTVVSVGWAGGAIGDTETTDIDTGLGGTLVMAVSATATGSPGRGSAMGRACRATVDRREQRHEREDADGGDHPGTATGHALSAINRPAPLTRSRSSG